jgi:hypothetical protein
MKQQQIYTIGMYEEGKTKAIGDSKSSCGDRVNESWRLQRKRNVITDLTEHKVSSLSRRVTDIHSWLAGWLPCWWVCHKITKLTTWVRCKQASNSKLMNSKQFLSAIICLHILFPQFCHKLT